jgi:hypothetical protein
LVKDELTWKDVYAKKPVEYLEAVAVGETPMWSSELKKYVYGDKLRFLWVVQKKKKHQLLIHKRKKIPNYRFK